MENYFSTLSKIDCSNHIEKKGKFNYLSWSYAVQKLREFDHTATWEVIRFDGMPYMKTDLGYFVEVAVTVKGITLSQIHPVLNNQNRPIAQPTSFDINTSIQRCLVKCIGLHGLGLYIYAGEDLPDGAEEEQNASRVATLKAKWQTLAGNLDGFDTWYNSMKEKKHTDQQLDEVLTKKLKEKQ